MATDVLPIPLAPPDKWKLGILAGVGALIALTIILSNVFTFTSTQVSSDSVWQSQGASGCQYSPGQTGTAVDGVAFDAFYPGLRGFGTCNRGGFIPNTNVIVVTNRNSSGSGSLASAVAAGCPKVILFGVAGLITMGSTQTNNCNNWSLVGASAPGNVTITGGTAIQFRPNGDNWTVDHMIFAPVSGELQGGDTSNRDAFGFSPGAQNGVVMNIAAIWGSDGTLDCNPSTGADVSNMTVIGSVIGIGVNPSHNFNMVMFGRCHEFALIRNLMPHTDRRNPESRSDNILIANSHIHNRASTTFFGTPCNTPGANRPGPTDTNYVGNIYTRGPNQGGSSGIHVAYSFPDGTCFVQRAYVNNNAIEEGSTGALTNCGLNQCTSGSLSFNGGGYQSSPLPDAWPTGFVYEPLPTNAAGVETAGKKVLQYVGPRPVSRLPYLATIIGEAENGLDNTGSLGSHATNSTGEGGYAAITPTAISGYDPTSAAQNPCGVNMPTGAAANQIVPVSSGGSGLTALHEWVITCFYDNVMPAGWRESL